MAGLNQGALDRLVVIEQLSESIGASGFPVETWTTLADRVWMSRESQTGRERFVAGQLSAPATIRWEMRYRADMDPDLVDVPKRRRLSMNGATYDIVDADHIGRKDGVALTTLSR